jgi:hypothetical protein
MNASLEINVSDELAARTSSQMLGLVGLELYNLINNCATLDQLQAAGGLIWEAYGLGRLNDEEATYLGFCIDRRRGVSGRNWSLACAASATPLPTLRGRFRKFFPRKPQRSPDREASRGRRRMLGGSSVLPPDLRHLFTEGERAVLCVIASEVKRQGWCDWPIDKLAALAGVCRTMVQNTLRKAKSHGSITVLERKRPGLKNLPNVVRVACKEWLAWLKRGFATACLIGLKAVKKLSPTEIIDLRKKGAFSENGPNDHHPRSHSQPKVPASNLNRIEILVRGSP